MSSNGSSSGLDLPVHNRVTEEQLEPGDHVYYHTLCYAYTHHAIYIGGGEVIHRQCGVSELRGKADLFLSQVRQSADRSLFASLRSTESSQSASTSTSGALTEATPSSEQEGEEGDGGHAKVVSTTADSPPSYSEAAAAASESPYKDSDLVCRISLKEFVGVHDLRRFQYAQASLRVTLEASGTGSEYPRTTRQTTVNLAEWFLKNPDVFADYDSDSWHCQHFATFCCTTWLKVPDLEEVQRQGGLTREFLLEQSNACGDQTEGMLPSIRTASRVLFSPVILAMDLVASKVLKPRQSD